MCRSTSVGLSTSRSRISISACNFLISTRFRLFTKFATSLCKLAISSRRSLPNIVRIDKSSTSNTRNLILSELKSGSFLIAFISFLRCSIDALNKCNSPIDSVGTELCGDMVEVVVCSEGVVWSQLSD